MPGNAGLQKIMEGVLLDAAGKVTNADPILGSVCVVLAIVIGALFFISRKDARELRKEYEGRLLEEKNRTRRNARQTNHQH